MSTEQIAREVLAWLEDAWNAGDGSAFGEPYRQDASFVTIRGELNHGKEIGAGHAQILATIYRGSTNHMELLEAKQVSDDVIVATSRNTLEAPQGALAGPHAAMSTSVLVRSGDEWRIAASQNTLVGAR
ncbi:MAG: SgcJ/EcaC family oxidoreductase [Lapillicoccus sp.]